jgi:hypothetical protein
MTIAEAKKELTRLGFKMVRSPGTWGSKPPEPYSVGKNHFSPYFRDVFIGETRTGFYVSSNIVGKMRRYRCRRWDGAKVGNIFGGGITLDAAIKEFIENFVSKTYNIRP